MVQYFTDFSEYPAGTPPFERVRMPVAIFDFDGCLCQNPYHDPAIKREVADPQYWVRHWESNPPPHQDMVDLLQALVVAGWRIFIITGRPMEYFGATKAWLEHQDIAPHVLSPGDLAGFATRLGMGLADDNDPRIVLCMNPGFYAREWKVNMARSLAHYWNVDVRFAVEDHKPNADALREFVPVLLYERQRARQ